MKFNILYFIKDHKPKQKQGFVKGSPKNNQVSSRQSSKLADDIAEDNEQSKYIDRYYVQIINYRI